MYLTRQDINTLRSIFTELNRLDTEEAQTEFLDRHVEDTDLLLNTLKTLNKSKLPRQHKPQNEDPAALTEAKLYDDAQLNCIFGEKDDDTIVREYSSAELKAMYYSAYQRKAATGHTKRDIVKTLRRRYYAAKRGDAFTRLADERAKRGYDS